MQLLFAWMFELKGLPLFAWLFKLKGLGAAAPLLGHLLLLRLQLERLQPRLARLPRLLPISETAPLQHISCSQC